MSKDEAPETIWIDALGIPESAIYAGTYYLNGDEDHHTIEYRKVGTPPTLKQAMELPEVKALIEALENIAHGGSYTDMQIARLSLAPFKEDFI